MSEGSTTVTNEDTSMSAQATSPSNNGHEPTKNKLPIGPGWPERQRAAWTRSPERVTFWRAAFICLGVTILPLIVAAAILVKIQMDSGVRATQSAAIVQAAQLNVVQADKTVALYLSRVDQDEQRITEVTAGKNVGVPKSQLLSTLVSDQKGLTSAESQLALTQKNLSTTQASYIGASANPISKWAVYGGIAIGALLGDMLIITYVRVSKYRDFQNDLIVKELTKTEEQLPLDGTSELSNLWRANEEQIKGYHRLVLNYAASTRLTTQLVMLAGFLFLLAVSIFAIFSHTLASAVASSVVATAGAAVTGFIARAILRNSESSSREVVNFFSHPLETQRILTAQRLIETMPEESQQQAKLQMIKALTQANRTKA